MAVEKPRVIYDCNIFWRAFFSAKGLGRKCKNLIDDGSVLHFISNDIVKELNDVLARPRTLARFSEASLDDVSTFVKEVISHSTFIPSVPSVFELFRDRKDEPYVNLAAFVNADYIVTTDRDLLDLMTGIDVESKQFRQRFRNLKIFKPDEFLQIILDRGLPLEP